MPGSNAQRGVFGLAPRSSPGAPQAANKASTCRHLGSKPPQGIVVHKLDTSKKERRSLSRGGAVEVILSARCTDFRSPPQFYSSCNTPRWVEVGRRCYTQA